MATNLHIDPRLLANAVKAGGHKTKRETVEEALRQYIRHRDQKRVIELFGTIDSMASPRELKAQRSRDMGNRRNRNGK
jgi:Arc/MetJ family transcription regulator